MKKERFNNNWNFQYEGDVVFAEINGVASKESKIVTLPHDASIALVRNPKEPHGTGNGYFQEGNYKYTKKFILEERDKDRSIWIEFEGIYQNAYVYVNQSYVGKCAYGYSNFYLDITKYVHPGENVINVIVKNAVPSGRWYTGGGIYRDVNIMIADRMHFLPDGVHLSTISLEQELAVISVESELEYTGLGNRDIRLCQELYNAEGELVARDEIPVTVSEHTTHHLRQKLYVDKPVKWDTDNPYLYHYHACITENGKILDEEEGIFGIRSLQLDIRNGLRINGESVKLRGGCIHHDNGIIGAAEFAHAEECRVRELKKAGYNAIRSCHYPMSRKLLEVCDRLGMYVMDEFSDVWVSTKVDFDYGMHMMDCWERDVENMVKKDFNHPCVIMYSTGNEIPEAGNKFDVCWGKKLADKFRSLDSSRYVTNGINMLMSTLDRIDTICRKLAEEEAVKMNIEGTDAEINELMTRFGSDLDKVMCSDLAADWTEEACTHIDIVGYNYAAGRYEKDGITYPNRIIVGAETYPRDLDRNWELVEKLPYVIGDFAWTAWDYLGETGIGKIRYGIDVGINFYADYPTKAAYCGDFNLLGDRRPISYWREIVWGMRRAPYIAVQTPQHYGEKKGMTGWAMTDSVHSWNWKGYEGRPVAVEVYSDADEAALYINGRFIEKKKIGERKKAAVIFDTIYEPGKIEVEVYRNGKEAGKDQILTAKDQIFLCAQSDRLEIPMDGSDICYVDLFIRDQDGTLNMEWKKEVKVEIQGPGTVLGYGSADPESEENYFDISARPFEGRLRAAVRGTGGKGTISVIFTADQDKKALVNIKAV